jgi:hypothetical protein
VAYPVWALAVGHGLLVGTDSEAMRLLALVCTGLVLLATAIRLVVRPRDTHPAPPASPTRAAAGIGGTP